MKTEIRRNLVDGDAYDLWVNGTREIVAESFSVVSAVQDSLAGAPGTMTEIREVADGLRRKDGAA